MAAIEERERKLWRLKMVLVVVGMMMMIVIVE
jgi:hypothetical protein